MARVFYRSWSQGEAGIELDRINNLGLTNEWLSGHTEYQKIKLKDVWLSTNGAEQVPGAGFTQMSWHAESYVYNRQQHDIFPVDKRFNLRFHFNPNFCKYPNTKQLSIYTWWKNELPLFLETVKNKKPEFMFGMVLGKKPEDRSTFPSCYFGHARSEIVRASKNRSFRYYGYDWSKDDPNYGGEAYVKGNRSDPAKFHDARILMTKAKFVWATENTHDEFYSKNYLTEKMWHGFLAASVPIYAGCWNIDELIDPSLYIDMRKFNHDYEAIMNYCEKMPEMEYQGYLSRIGDFLTKEGQSFTGESRFKELDRHIHNYFI